jgi:hypothetical protein
MQEARVVQEEAGWNVNAESTSTSNANANANEFVVQGVERIWND